MTFWAQPPDFTIRSNDDIRRFQITIQSWMPFCSYLWTSCGQIIDAGTNKKICTDWTTAVIPAAKGRLPLMTAFAQPPDIFVRAAHYLGWLQREILCGMPFGQ